MARRALYLIITCRRYSVCTSSINSALSRSCGWGWIQCQWPQPTRLTNQRLASLASRSRRPFPFPSRPPSCSPFSPPIRPSHPTLARPPPSLPPPSAARQKLRALLLSTTRLGGRRELGPSQPRRDEYRDRPRRPEREAPLHRHRLSEADPSLVRLKPPAPRPQPTDVPNIAGKG